jgi:uncharacterized protein YuzE
MKVKCPLKFKYDKKADAIYIQLGNGSYAYGKDLDEERRIDYDSDNNPIGVELLCVSEGVITDNLPDRATIERLLGDKGVKIYA